MGGRYTQYSAHRSATTLPLLVTPTTRCRHSVLYNEFRDLPSLLEKWSGGHDNHSIGALSHDSPERSFEVTCAADFKGLNVESLTCGSPSCLAKLRVGMVRIPRYRNACYVRRCLLEQLKNLAPPGH